MANEEIAALQQKFELLKGAEQHKNTLIEDLLRRLVQLTEDHRQEKLDHARETQYNRVIQLREIEMQDEIRKYKSLMARDAFVLVLIDGDGMIFDERFLSQAEAGGKEAAALLWNAITKDVHHRLPDLGSDYKIVTRIYANLGGLGDVCNRSSIIDHPLHMAEFARGFTGSKQLFDFVDVGSGKDRADDKISEIFKLHLYDCHCRHIYFGCSHDNGYARLLEDVAETNIYNSITLLEGVPFERELESLKSRYQTTRFEGLFRTEKIDVYKSQSQSQYRGPLAPAIAPPPSNGVGLPPGPSQYQSPYQPTIANINVRSSSPATSTSSLNPTAPSWAVTAMAGGPRLGSPPLTPQPASQIPVKIPRNRYGQRIDPVVTYDPNEVKRIKKMKMCNVHFLRNDCPYDPCTHDHHYKPTKNELQTLRYVSRMTPCHFGTECDDLRCIYGHRCPNDKEGSRECKWGENCRFDKESHGIDRKIVNVVKVGAK